MGRVGNRLSPALPHQTVRAVFPHTAFRCSSKTNGVRHDLSSTLLPGSSNTSPLPTRFSATRRFKDVVAANALFHARSKTRRRSQSSRPRGVHAVYKFVMHDSPCFFHPRVLRSGFWETVGDDFWLVYTTLVVDKRYLLIYMVIYFFKPNISVHKRPLRL